jgi:UDP-2,3-diacylglucosamine pyrophosphatase LpxH
MSEAPLRVRSLFVSDLHLGSAGCMVERFQSFLDLVECEHLYLVGDIIDLWVVMKKGKWRDEHTALVRQLLGKAQEGCHVCFTPGNHDAFLRRLNGSTLGNIRIDHQFVHMTADGRRFLVVHGDLFDNSVQFLPLAWAGAWIYEMLVVANGRLNARLEHSGREKIDIRRGIKQRVKRFIARRNDFEENILEAALAERYDGVICGHVHRPAILEGTEKGLYVNTGDWVEHGTAVVEHYDGTLELVSWESLMGSADSGQTQGTAAPTSARSFLRVRRGRSNPCEPSRTSPLD